MYDALGDELAGHGYRGTHPSDENREKSAESFNAAEQNYAFAAVATAAAVYGAVVCVRELYRSSDQVDSSQVQVSEAETTLALGQ